METESHPWTVYRLGALLARLDNDQDASPTAAPAIEEQAHGVHQRMVTGFVEIFGEDSDEVANAIGWPSASALQRFLKHGVWGDPN